MSAPPRAEPPPVPPSPPPRASRLWLLPMGLVVLAALIAVELAYGQWPMPPGVDPADWIQRSFAWVGLPAVAPDAVGSPFLYPPVLFPLLGAVERLTGSPITTGYVFGGLLLAGYGLTSIHLARRFLARGPTQLLFVGLTVLNGTTLSMFFWGAYPNLLALIFVNETLVFLKAFVGSRGLRDGLLFYAGLCLVYLTHDLTFVVLLAGVILAAMLFELADRRFYTILRTRASLLGLPMLGATVVGYALALRLAHIQAPSYLGSNPAAYVLDNIGRYFDPLAPGPFLSPAGPAVNFSPVAVELLLAGLGAAVLVASAFAVRRLRRLGPAWTITGGYLAAVLFVPVGGWIVHVDTDYTRFVYFVPLPAALGLALIAEVALERYLAAGAAAGDAVPKGTTGGPERIARPTGDPRPLIAGLAVGVVLIVLFSYVALPTIATNESENAGTSHDAAFLASLRFLAADPTPGAVLTLQSSVRWVEAVSGRGAFDVGPTWLLFEPWQIVNAEETYWAFNSEVALTNNAVALGFSGGYRGVDDSPLISAPVYAVYVDGVQVPVVDLATAGILVNATTPAGTGLYPAGAWGAPQLTVAPNGSALATLAFAGPYFNVSELAQVPSGGAASVTFSVVPSAGTVVHALELRLAMPSNAVALLGAPSPAGVTTTPDGVAWSVDRTIGPETSPTTVTTTITASPAPASVGIPPGPDAAFFNFSDLGGGAMNATLRFSTPGTSNPAVTLPPVMSTSAFLAEHEIRYLLVPAKSGYEYTSAYYALVFGYRTIYAGNPEWTVAAA